MQGCSFCEIARKTGRARQTVTKVVRAPDIQDKILEMRAALLAESGDWVESLSRAVRHEMDGKLAFKLARAFDAIPSLVRKAEPSKVQNSLQNIDPRTVAAAKVLGQIALERGSAPPLEADELENLVRKGEL
jgi:IS30 family transposase